MSNKYTCLSIVSVEFWYGNIPTTFRVFVGYLVGGRSDSIIHWKIDGNRAIHLWWIKSSSLKDVNLVLFLSYI